jgi:hypothetical protein
LILLLLTFNHHLLGYPFFAATTITSQRKGETPRRPSQSTGTRARPVFG